MYGDSYLRTNRLMTELEEILQNRSMKWSILYITRDHEDFIRLCRNQLIKSGNKIKSSFYTFKKNTNFSHAKTNKLNQTLIKLCTEREVRLINMAYEEIVDPRRTNNTFMEYFKSISTRIS